MTTIEEISVLLDSKLQPINARLTAIENKLNSVEAKVSTLSEQVRKVLMFVPTDNADFNGHSKIGV